jgi:hypothetical protein
MINIKSSGVVGVQGGEGRYVGLYGYGYGYGELRLDFTVQAWQTGREVRGGVSQSRVMNFFLILFAGVEMGRSHGYI